MGKKRTTYGRITYWLIVLLIAISSEAGVAAADPVEEVASAGAFSVITEDGNTFNCSFEAKVQPAGTGWVASGSSVCSEAGVTPTHLGVTLKYTDPDDDESSKGCGDPPGMEGFPPPCKKVSHRMGLGCVSCTEGELAKTENGHYFIFPSKIDDNVNPLPPNCEQPPQDNEPEIEGRSVLCVTRPQSMYAGNSFNEGSWSGAFSVITEDGNTFNCSFEAKVQPAGTGWVASGSSVCSEAGVTPTHLGVTLKYTDPDDDESSKGCGDPPGMEGFPPPCKKVSHRMGLGCVSCTEGELAKTENRHYFIFPSKISEFVGPVSCDELPQENEPEIQGRSVLCITRPQSMYVGDSLNEDSWAGAFSVITESGTTFNCSFEAKVQPAGEGWTDSGTTKCNSDTGVTPTHLGITLVFTQPTYQESSNGCGDPPGLDGYPPPCSNVSHRLGLMCKQCYNVEVARTNNRHYFIFPTEIREFVDPMPFNCHEPPQDEEPDILGKSILCITKPQSPRPISGGTAASWSGRFAVVTEADGIFHCSFESRVHPGGNGFLSSGVAACSTEEESTVPTHLGLSLRYVSYPSVLLEGWKGCGTPPGFEGYPPPCSKITHRLGLPCTNCTQPEEAYMQNRHLYVFPSNIKEYLEPLPFNCSGPTDTSPGQSILCITEPMTLRPGGDLPIDSFQVTTEDGKSVECSFDAQLTPQRRGWRGSGTTDCSETSTPTVKHMGVSLFLVGPESYSEVWAGCGNPSQAANNYPECTPYPRKTVSKSVTIPCGNSCSETSTATLTDNRHFVLLHEPIETGVWPASCTLFDDFSILCYSSSTSERDPEDPRWIAPPLTDEAGDGKLWATVEGDLLPFNCSFSATLTATDSGWLAFGTTSCNRSVSHLGVSLIYTQPNVSNPESWSGCNQDNEVPCTATGHEHQIDCSNCLNASMANRHFIIFPSRIIDWDGPTNCAEFDERSILCGTSPSATK